MAEELNVNVTGINLPPLKVEGTFTIPSIRIEGQNGKSAYEIWLEAGNSGTREDFINSLKGQNGADGRNGNNGLPGKDATADGAYEMLLGLNVYCENATTDEVLKGLIRGLGDAINKPFKQLEFDRPQKGQTYVNVYGTPHFKVALLGKGFANSISIGDNGRARLDLDKPFEADDIQLEYFNMLGRTVGTYRITGYSDIKTTLSRGDIADTSTIEINFPEVTTVNDMALIDLHFVERIILPKCRRIGQDAFRENWDIKLIKLPIYVLDEGSPLLSLTNIQAGAEIFISEESNAGAVWRLLDKQRYGNITCYNGDGTKKFNEGTKTWVPAQ